MNTRQAITEWCRGCGVSSPTVYMWFTSYDLKNDYLIGSTIDEKPYNVDGLFKYDRYQDSTNYYILPGNSGIVWITSQESLSYVPTHGGTQQREVVAATTVLNIIVHPSLESLITGSGLDDHTSFMEFSILLSLSYNMTDRDSDVIELGSRLYSMMTDIAGVPLESIITAELF